MEKWMSFLIKIGLITMIGSLSALGIAAVAGIGGTYLLWPMIIP